MLWLPAPARAVLFKSTGDPAYNTTAPGGALTNSGWQYEGQFGGFLATPIAPRFFLAAQHIGAYPTFSFNNVTYNATNYFDCPNTDLRIFVVDQTFASWAPLYTNKNEAGKHCVLIGRGTERGDPIVSRNVTNGWKWGSDTQVQRWGENDVQTNVSDPDLGDFLYCAFDRSGNSNECDLSVGDSGGAMFIQESGVWKLAGIHYGVDGPFSDNSSGSNSFIAAFLNAAGYYYDDGSGWSLISFPTPTGSYSSRVSAHIDWILSVIDDQPAGDFGIEGVQVSGDAIVLSLKTTAGRTYRVDDSETLASPAWAPLAPAFTATNTLTQVTDTSAGAACRYYRLALTQ